MGNCAYRCGFSRVVGVDDCNSGGNIFAIRGNVGGNSGTMGVTCRIGRLFGRRRCVRRGLDCGRRRNDGVCGNQYCVNMRRIDRICVFRLLTGKERSVADEKSR